MEIWKPIKGFEDYYEVSNMGRVRSKDRVIVTKRFPSGIHYKSKILKPSKNHKGYPHISININGKRYCREIHRLVAKAFIDNPENKPQVNHKNGIKSDNRVENLEWVTNSENQKHSFNVLGRKAHIVNRKLTYSQAEEIRKDNRPQIEIAKEYNICPQTISRIKLGKSYINREV